KLDPLEAEVADRGAKSGIAYRQADCQTQSKDAVDQALAEFSIFAELGIEMERLGIHGHGSKQQVVSFGNRASGLVMKDVSDGKFLEVVAGHGVLLEQMLVEVSLPLPQWSCHYEPSVVSC